MGGKVWLNWFWLNAVIIAPPPLQRPLIKVKNKHIMSWMSPRIPATFCIWDWLFINTSPDNSSISFIRHVTARRCQGSAPIHLRPAPCRSGGGGTSKNHCLFSAFCLEIHNCQVTFPINVIRRDVISSQCVQASRTLGAEERGGGGAAQRSQPGRNAVWAL